MASAILSTIFKWMTSYKTRIPIITTPSSVHEDLLDLETTLQKIQLVLSDAEEREIREESVKLWLKELKALAHDAEDVLDEYGYELLQAKAKTSVDSSHKRKREEEEEVSKSMITSTSSSTSSQVSVPVPKGMPAKIKSIRMRFDDITEARNSLQLKETEVEMIKVESSFQSSLPTTPFMDECVYGRDDDKDRLVEMLLSDSKGVSGNFSVIPIVGMGGIGKTTLARLVYNDPTVCKHFNLRLWVCVSLDFDLIKLCKAIMQLITKEACDLTELNELQSALYEEIKGKKLLLVLDDVWNETVNPWESFRDTLVGGGGLRRVIVTTRNESVAKIMQTVNEPYRLGQLPEDQCWLLFQRYAFDERYELDEHSNLVELGEKIVAKCNGLPLAVKAIGGLLRFELNEERWEDILESEIWELDEESDDILPALKLSYHRMPSSLKPCFLYCSLFPKNYLFDKDRLVKLWMSQGLIQYREDSTAEEIGRQYFDDLVTRSFFQCCQVDEDELPPIRSGLEFSQIGNDDMLKKSFFLFTQEVDQKPFVMHDLICDLARSVAGEECCVTENENVDNIADGARHLSVTPTDFKAKDHSFDERKPVRSFLCINRAVNTWNGSTFGHGSLLPVRIPNEVFLNLNCLRAVDLSYTSIDELPDSIGQLKHLRLLSLQGCQIKRLPESISRLYYLQILDLKYCKNLQHLPKGIAQLINLRHLELPMMNYASRIHLPSGIGNLTSLQTLTAFHVGKNGEGCKIGELKDLMNLRGHLGISGLQNVYRGKDAITANLREKQHLQTLALIWDDGGDRGEQHSVDVKRFVAEGVFENLRPHGDLTQLVVRGYVGAKFPSWLGDPFFKLTCITLLKCYDCKFLPPLGQLPFLQHLLVGYMHGVQSIGDEFYGNETKQHKAFQALETLDIECMNEWKEWDEAENDGVEFACLHKLVIKDCLKLKRLPSCLSSPLKSLELENVRGIVSLPALPMLKSLTLGGNWTDELWKCLEHLPSLESLEICSSENLSTLGLPGKLKHLKELEVQHCPELTSIVKLHEWSSLESLQLYSLDMFQLSLDDQLPSSIRALHLTSCTSLTCIPLHHLSSLRELLVVNCPQLGSLLNLQSLESLERLELIECPELCFSPDEVLPATLQSFEVSGCKNLKSLPLLHCNLTELKVLKVEDCLKLAIIVGLRNLSSLECLEISFCPVLSLSNDEPVLFTDVDVSIQDCPGLVEWCREHGIKYIQDDDLEDNFDEGHFDRGEGGEGDDDDDEDNWAELETDNTD